MPVVFPNLPSPPPLLPPPLFNNSFSLFTKYFTREKKLLQRAWRKARCVIQAAVLNSFEAHILFKKKYSMYSFPIIMGLVNNEKMSSANISESKFPGCHYLTAVQHFKRLVLMKHHIQVCAHRAFHKVIAGV